MDIESGQQFSLWCIRLAVLCWFVFAIAIVNWPKCRDAKTSNDKADSNGPGVKSDGVKSGEKPFARWFWIAATGLLLVHIVSAFAFYHDWSHSLAAAHTAQRTEAFTGLYWSGGIWFNYLFLLACLIESYFWWSRPEVIAGRPQILNRILYGFVIFMIFNAAVVFVSGPARWINLTGFAVVGWYTRRRLAS